MAGPIVTVEHLVKRYGDEVALSDVSFEVAAGEIFGIIGPNGSGKTTTVECLQGLRRFDGGTVRVLGLDPSREAEQLRRRVGAQLQESALPDRMKVWEALWFFSSLRSGGPPWEEVMADWGLDHRRNAAFASLSGGEQQRLFVALALLNAPEIVFLDEMTTGLDPSARHVAWGLIEQVRDQGTTVVIVTHFMDEADRLCDRVAVLDRHQVVELGPPTELVRRLAGPGEVTFTTDADLAFLSEVDEVDDVRRSGRHVTVTGHGPVLAVVAAALVDHGIRPDDLDIRRPGLEDVYLELTSAGDR